MAGDLMLLEDLTVEVRDPNLQRVGIILAEDLQLQANPVFNNVGSWQLIIGAEHPLAPMLRTPGAGIIVTGPQGVILSGPVDTPENAQTPDDPVGTVTISGITDDIILRDALAYPKPDTADVTAQTVSHDQRTGAIETVMHAYVNANIGPGAPSVRRGHLASFLQMGTDGGRGGNITKAVRFPVLGNVLLELAQAGNLGFRVVQVDDHLEFQTYAVADKSNLIRLSAENGSLAGQRVSTSPPGSTRVIVAGQGDEENRTFKEVSTTTSLASEVLWGRRIEFFKDERNTNDDTELNQAGLDQLTDDGFTTLKVQAVPADDEDGTMRFGIDWGMGDTVAVVVEDEELKSIVTGLALVANGTDGLKVGAVIGDPVGFDYQAAVNVRVGKLEARLSKLELSAEMPESLSTDLSTLQDDMLAAQDDIDTVTTTAATSATQLAKLPVSMAAGFISITPSGAGTPTSGIVAFPSGRFSVAPVIALGLNSSVPGSAVTGIGFASVSASQMTVYVTRTNTFATLVQWHAIQMTATSGAG